MNEISVLREEILKIVGESIKEMGAKKEKTAAELAALAAAVEAFDKAARGIG